MGFECFSVARVPFTFSDRDAAKNRPARVLSDAGRFNNLAGYSVMAMITSESNPHRPLDCGLKDLAAAGLPAPSKVRLKLFTLDHRLVRGQLGVLSKADAQRGHAALTQLLGVQRPD